MRDHGPPVVLAIAGSDSGGGAGIQADLKAFAAAQVHGTTAITAITAQNTIGVQAVGAVSPDLILAQVRSVAGDFDLAAVKIGMLADVPTIDAVAQALAELPAHIPVVHDPVMVAESGSELLAPEALDALRAQIVSRATVVTPNLAEARVLAGLPAADGLELARGIARLGPQWVLVTGGHRDEAADLLFDGETLVTLPGPRYPDGCAHGSGCTHASTLAARLAHGDDVPQAARAARDIAARAVRDGLRGLGAGAGPVNVLGLGPARGTQASIRP